MKLIDHRTKEPIYEAETSTMAELLEKAVAERKGLHYADLHGVNLIDAKLARANLSSADLASANLSYANLASANLSYAILTYANLRYADLRYADLSCTDLCNANLYGADLCNANLYGADLCNANLYGADLKYANLYGADLKYAKLAENVSVTGTTWRTYTSISNVGSRNDTLHLFNTDAGIFVKTGCFSGTVDQFMAAVEAAHGKTRYAEDYAAAIVFAKQYFKE